MEVAYKICIGGNSYCHNYCLLYLIWACNNAMRPLGYHAPHIFDNADTLYLQNHHWEQAVFFLYKFFLCVFISLPLSLSFCGSVSLIAIHLKFLKACCYKVASDLSNKKWWKKQWLTLGDWGCPLDNDSKLVMGQPNSR